MSDFQLGQRVAYSTHIQRRHARPGEFLGPHRIWSDNPGPAFHSRRWPGGEGIIVGKRQLANGDVVYPYDNAGGQFVASERFTAWLIAYDLHRRPVHVLPEHIEPIAESETTS